MVKRDKTSQLVTADSNRRIFRAGERDGRHPATVAAKKVPAFAEKGVPPLGLVSLNCVLDRTAWGGDTEETFEDGLELPQLESVPLSGCPGVT